MLVIAGPCVLEDQSMGLEIAQELSRQFEGLPIDFYFKASFDKANRTSIHSFRGLGIDEGLKTLGSIKEKTSHKVLTDIHEPDQAERVAEVVDALQIPAFLCRQTDLVVAAAQACLKEKIRLNIKKGQFLAPWDAQQILQKVAQTTDASKVSDLGSWVSMTERGVSFGYNNLIVDMAGIQEMQSTGVPVIYDATHSVQQPGGGSGGSVTGGKRQNIEVLARAAVAAGADGIFLECHPEPSRAKSDASNAFYLDRVGKFIQQLLQIHELVRPMPKLISKEEA